jgi:hypothetical protein
MYTCARAHVTVNKENNKENKMNEEKHEGGANAH